MSAGCGAGTWRLAASGLSADAGGTCPERRPRTDAYDEEDRVAVQLDPQLMDILACPSEDHAPLRAGSPDDPDADVLTCTACGRRFPVVDGIPVLLLDEAIPPVPADGNGA
jgi:uncharacterized protein YbaR (Trm112 family)